MDDREKLIEPCEICEGFIKGVPCEQSNCPVAKMKKQNQMLKDEIQRLKLEMSYMVNPHTIGDSHEMGGMVNG